MASHVLTRSLSSSRNLIVAYLPSLSAASAYFRSFCSDSNRWDRTINVDITVQSASDKKEGLPETKWGPLGRGDERFPLPGQMGLGALEPAVANELPQQSDLPRSPQSPDILTTQLSFERHVDVYQQVKHQIPTLVKERSKELKKLHADCLKHQAEIIEQRLLNASDPEERRDLQSLQDFSKELTEDDLECSIFSCPTLLKNDFNALFPDMDFTNLHLSVVLLCQKTVNDMTGWSEDVDFEREELLHSFYDAAQSMTDLLKKAGYWADFIDPSSGKPFLSAHTSATLFETDERFRQLGLEIEDLGCCKVVRHHKWGTHAYVGCVFTTAPMELMEALQCNYFL